MTICGDLHQGGVKEKCPVDLPNSPDDHRVPQRCCSEDAEVSDHEDSLLVVDELSDDEEASCGSPEDLSSTVEPERRALDQESPVSTPTSEDSESSRASTPSNDLELGPRSRTNFTREQVRALKAVFEDNQYPDKLHYDKLSDRLQLDDKCIRLWFQNHRAKVRKMAHRSCHTPEDTDTESLDGKHGTLMDLSAMPEGAKCPSSPVYEVMTQVSLPPDHPFCKLANISRQKRSSPESDDEEEEREEKPARCAKRARTTVSRRLPMASGRAHQQRSESPGSHSPSSGSHSPSSSSPLVLCPLPPTPPGSKSPKSTLSSPEQAAQRVPSLPMSVPFPGWPLMSPYAAAPFPGALVAPVSLTTSTAPTIPPLPLRPTFFPIMHPASGYLQMAWPHVPSINPMWMGARMPLR